MGRKPLTPKQREQNRAYLAVVLDAFSRRVVGCAMETHMRANLAIAALQMAIVALRPALRSLVHLSDRGVQYACCEHAAVLEMHDIAPSMSRIANPYDNAKAESFMKTLKQEEVDGRSYRDLKQARDAIGTFIEEVYNRHPRARFSYSPEAGAVYRRVTASSMRCLLSLGLRVWFVSTSAASLASSSSLITVLNQSE
jgi:transposase InsO family protein